MDSKSVTLDHYCCINPEVVTKQYSCDQIRYFDISSVGTGTLNEEPKKYFLSQSPSRAKRIIRLGDTILSTVRPNRRSFLFFKEVQDGDIVSTGFAVLRAKPSVDPRFIYYLISDQRFTDFLISHATGSAYPAVSPESIKNAPVPFFDYHKQKAIADILSSLDDKIELNRQMCNTLEEIASTLFKSWFIDFDPVKAKSEGRKPEGLSPEIADLFPDRFVDSPMGRIPEGWNIDKIGNLVDIAGGSTPSTKNDLFWLNGQHNWVTPKDLSILDHSVLLGSATKITNAGLSKISSGLLPIRTVLLSSRAPIGYVAITEVPVAINQGFIAIKHNKTMGTHFIYQWVLANIETIKSHSNGSTFLEINKTSFRQINIYHPNTTLLEKFEIIADAIHSKIVSIAKEINAISKTRDSLMQKLISGKLKINNIEI